MVEIGKYNTLRVVKIVDFGVYLDGDDEGEILMPNEYVPENIFPDDEVRVFVYFDSEDRIIATTENPVILVDGFAYMRAVSTTSIGAFMDWGLRKDLFVPFREQLEPIEEGKYYMVHAYLDDRTQRIVGSTKIDHFLDETIPDYEVEEEVELIIARKTDLGYAVIVNESDWGLIYNNEIFQSLKLGQKIKGYIKEIREDGKIDVTLNKSGYEKIDGLAGDILEKLKDYGGILDISDKSKPEDIYRICGCSKKNFKKALGTLFKKGLIEILPKEVHLK